MTISANDFDPGILRVALATLSDEELSKLEDDLDFCNFTGVPSQRVLKLLKSYVGLDSEWEQMLRTKSNPEVPAIY